MFKMFPPTFLLAPVAWLTVFLVTLMGAWTPLMASWGITPKTSWAILAVQAVFTLLLVTPAWRLLWRLIPPLNRWVFPDLNGEGDVEGATNWTRIDAVLKAANRETRQKLDMRAGPEDQLPPLGRTLMRAEIRQSWMDIRVTLWDPTGGGPIDQSETLTVQPFRGAHGRHGLVYVFEQKNRPDVHDDRSFFGAARIVVDRADHDLLCGHMWSDRMWRRGMNTAAEIKFKRRS